MLARYPATAGITIRTTPGALMRTPWAVVPRVPAWISPITVTVIDPSLASPIP